MPTRLLPQGRLHRHQKLHRNVCGDGGGGDGGGGSSDGGGDGVGVGGSLNGLNLVKYF